MSDAGSPSTQPTQPGQPKPPVEPVLRIHNADVTAQEVAAILAVLASGGAGSRAGGQVDPASSVWQRGVGLRATRAGDGPLEPGPDAWRTSAWPR